MSRFALRLPGRPNIRCLCTLLRAARWWWGPDSIMLLVRSPWKEASDKNYTAGLRPQKAMPPGGTQYTRQIAKCSNHKIWLFD